MLVLSAIEQPLSRWGVGNADRRDSTSFKKRSAPRPTGRDFVLNVTVENLTPRRAWASLKAAGCRRAVQPAQLK